jgi:response regulator RpfG family c-di-GMP phosphodiesterase
MTPSDIAIVHVDDEPSILSALRRSLTRVCVGRGVHVNIRSFTSAGAALGTLLTEPVDVVISDYRMPEMDGVELLRRVRELQPYTGRILLSGSTEYSFLLMAVNQAAVTRVLVKPWVEEELFDAIRQSVAVRRLQLENAELADQVRVQRGLLSQKEATLRRIASLHPEITEVICAGEAQTPNSEPALQREDAHD